MALHQSSYVMLLFLWQEAYLKLNFYLLQTEATLHQHVVCYKQAGLIIGRYIQLWFVGKCVQFCDLFC